MPIVINVATQADLSAFQKMSQALQQARQQGQQATAGNQAAGQSGKTYSSKKPPQVGPTMFEQYKYLDAANKTTGGAFQAQRNQALADAYNAAAQHAQSTGDPKAIAQMGQLANQIQKLNGSGGGGGFMQSLGHLLSNSRFGKGGIQPRVGDAMELLGKAGPLGMAVGMGASIITGFAAAVSNAADSINEFTSGMLAAQTSSETYSRVQGFSGLLGGDPAQVAKNFMERARSDPYAAQHAMRAGINPYAPDWTQDFGDAFERLAKSFQGLSLKEAQTKANQMGDPNLAKLSFLEASDFKAIADALKPLSGQQMKDAARFSTYAAVAQQSLSNTLQRLASSYLPAATKGLQEFVGVMSGISAIFDKIKDEKWFKIALGAMGNGEKGWEATKSVALGPAAAAWDWLNAKGKEASSANKDLRDNTNELRKMNANMRENGIYGGGGRAQRAIPSRVRGPYMNERSYRQALSTGLA